MIRAIFLSAAILSGFAAQTARAHDNEAKITVSGNQRCILSNGTPDHSIGQFPTRGNPNRFKAQSVKVCVDATPARTGRTVTRTNASGITLTGIMLRPGTAEFYDASSRRGFSRNRASGWQVEGMGGADMLGMDHANAHVDKRGLYHYHAPADIWTGSGQGSLIGYAADGFEIHYVGDRAQSAYQLKSGPRSGGPGGCHDGTYVQDWVYKAGSGNLDDCNGAMLDGRYVYFATDSYPFFPRCFKGTVSRDFLGRP